MPKAPITWRRMQDNVREIRALARSLQRTKRLTAEARKLAETIEAKAEEILDRSNGD